ncbi:MAG: hypothetical protein CMH34_12995 [Microbacterium sp.]|nr:hypothetical protein [Microbacterium sp.]|tara:strand:- start:432 stop:704 length:273 start_codon:yes stop_codon:yes gene_type:complete
MNSLTDLVDVVIGVDTHVLTHTAAVMDAGTGGVLAQLTVDATAAGYAELVGFANAHGSSRTLTGACGHGRSRARAGTEPGSPAISRRRAS